MSKKPLQKLRCNYSETGKDMSVMRGKKQEAVLSEMVVYPAHRYRCIWNRQLLQGKTE